MSHAERCPGRGIQKGEEKRDTPSRRPDFRLPEIVPAPESGGRPWPETCTAAHSLSIGKIIPPLHEETGGPCKSPRFFFASGIQGWARGATKSRGIPHNVGEGKEGKAAVQVATRVFFLVYALVK